MWPSILAPSTNWLIILPHGAGGGQAGGDYEERVGLAFGCNTTQLVLILNSGWLSHARSQSEIKYISGTSVTVFMW